MNFEEHAGKRLLADAGIATPTGRLALTPEEARAAARDIGPVVVKAQIGAGKRGKAGGIVLADTPDAAADAARRILAMTIDGRPVARVLVEQRIVIARECYAAVLNDPASGGPLVLFSPAGGVEIEDIAANTPELLRRRTVDIGKGFDLGDAVAMLDGLDLGAAADNVATVLLQLYQLYREHDAELVEVNPLAITDRGGVVALDCKFILDDAAVSRQAALAEQGAAEPMTALERRGHALGLRYIELDGSVGLLANGAGLTMTTMDAIRHFGGRPANFLEIGGDAYTKAKPALELVLANPRVRSLVVNFCAAFARADVMTEGVVEAWRALSPTIPVFFTIHGTGEEAAVAMVRERLGMEPLDLMDDAVKAAVAAA